MGLTESTNMKKKRLSIEIKPDIQGRAQVCLGRRGPHKKHREQRTANRAVRKAAKGNRIPANAPLQPGESLCSHYHQQMSEVFLGSQWTCTHTTINFPEADSCAARSKDSFQMTAAPSLPKPP